ncbi:MAG: ABC transporter ATP-binding protein [Acidimicrobiia bacterium]|nr:ABC transporter ATP-binding protein [Acidimicrobiia bacterium]
MADLLEIAGVTAGYGATVILEDVTAAVKQGEALAVLGRNGVGKTTLMRTMAGHTTLHRGRIALDGRDVAALPSWKRARLGIGLVPQEREVFPSLTVLENITVATGLHRRSGEAAKAWSIERIFELFPPLADRRTNLGTQLSGGEQQMLSIGRALALQPKILLLDEPFEGLAPTIVETLVAVFQELRRAGLSIVLTEQHARLALEMTDNAVALVRGRIVVRDSSAALLRDPQALEDVLTVRG